MNILTDSLRFDNKGKKGNHTCENMQNHLKKGDSHIMKSDSKITSVENSGNNFF